MFYLTRKYRNVITGFSIWNIRHIIPCNVIGWESLSCILLASHAWLGPGQSSSLAVNHQGFMKCVSLPFVHPLLAAHNMQVSYQQVQLGMVPGQEDILPACHRLHSSKAKTVWQSLQNKLATKRILFHLLFLVVKPLFYQNTKKCCLSLTLSYSYTQ